MMLLIFFSISLLHTSTPNLIAYVVLACVYIIMLMYFMTKTDSIILADNIYVMLFLALSILVFLNVMLNASLGVAGQSVVLLTFTFFNIFFLPRVVPLSHFLYISSRYSAILVLIGFLPYAGLDIQTNMFDLSLWHGRLYIFPELNPITSIFGNPNAFGFLTLVGAIAALFEWQRFRSIPAAILFGINLIGLLFTNYRSGWIAFVICLILLLSYSFGGRGLLVSSIVGGISVFTFVMLVILGFLPGPTRLTEISIENRESTWIAGVQVIRDQYLLGHGFGNTGTVLNQYTPTGSTSGIHNSFIRIYIALGVVGVTIYLTFYFLTILKSAKQAVTYQQITIPVFLTIFFYVQVFESHSFLGASLLSVPIALMMGYHITKSEAPDYCSI